MSNATNSANAQVYVIDSGFSAPQTFTDRLPDSSARVFDLLGETILDGPEFGDDEWDLAALGGWPAGQTPAARILAFNDIPEVWRSLAKVAVLVELRPTEVSIKCALNRVAVTSVFGTRAAPKTVGVRLKLLKSALLAVINSGATPFNGVRPERWKHVEMLMRHGAGAMRSGKVGTASKPVQSKGARQAAHSIVVLQRVAEFFGWDQPFGSLPFKNLPLTRVFRESERSRFNAVRPTEDAEVAQTIASFFFESGIAQNILDAAKFWFVDKEELEHGDRFSDDQKRIAMDFIAKVFNDHGAFPQRENKGIDWARMARAAGLRPAHQTRSYLSPGKQKLAPHLKNRHEFEEWLRDVPKKEINFCPVEPVEVASFISGEMIPWCDPSDLEEGMEFRTKVGWITWMAVTLLHSEVGQRTGDRALLDRDTCVEQFTDADGQPRWRLHVWKQKNRIENPEPFDFPISETLFNAISMVRELHEVLGIEAAEIERLSHIPKRSGDKKWRHLLSSDLLPNKTGTKTGVVHSTKPFVAADVNDLLAHLNAHGICNEIELPNVTPQQFRVTAAQNYATATVHGRSIAARMGAWSNERTESGYIGDVRRRSSHATFSKENSYVDIETAANIQRGASIANLAQREDLNDAGEWRVNEMKLTHPEIDQIANKKLLTSDQVQKALKKIGEEEANRFHVGLFGACTYSSSRALCDGDGWLNSQDCRPAACRNSIQSKPDRAAYELHRRKIAELVDRDKTSILADELEVITQDSQHIIEEFAGVSDQELNEIARKAADIASIPVEITTKEDS